MAIGRNCFLWGVLSAPLSTCFLFRVACGDACSILFRCGPGRGERMLRLVEPELGAAGKRDRSHQAEARLGDWPAEFYTPLFEIGHRGFHIVTNQVELAMTSLLCRVDSQFGWRQGEDQPAVAGVDGGKVEDIAEKCADFFGVVGVENRVSAGDHSWASVRYFRG